MDRLSPEQYCEFGWKQHQKYIHDVQKGLILTNKWIKLAIKRFEDDLKREDLELRKDKVDKVFKFISLVNIKRNTQFPILGFQAFIIVNLFGLYYKGTNRRKYNYAFLFIARKNGKTAFAALLQLYFMLADGIESPENLLLASTTKQAKIALESIQKMISNSPILKKYLKYPKKGYDIVFRDFEKNGYISVFVPDSDKLDGYSPSSSILDEVHAYRDSGLFDIISQGILARENPLIFLVSTAGFEKDSFCNKLVDGGKDVLNKNTKDESFFYMLYSLDEKDDPNDKSCWIKANPALGKITNIEHLENFYDKAVSLPTSYNSFLTKSLNLFTQAHTEWIDNQTLDKVFGKLDTEKLKGKPCFGGLDLSSTQDLTSFSLFFNENDTYQVLTYFFLADNKKTRNSKYSYLYESWEKQGYLIRCNDESIDYDLVAQKIKELQEIYDIQAIGFDPYNILMIEKQLKKLGFHRKKYDDKEPNFIQINQTEGVLNSPMKFLESIVISKNISFTDNPILKWNFRNVVVKQERNYGNIKPVKNKNKDPIDGIISTLNAISVFLKNNVEENNTDDLLNNWLNAMNNY